MKTLTRYLTPAGVDRLFEKSPDRDRLVGLPVHVYADPVVGTFRAAGSYYRGVYSSAGRFLGGYIKAEFLADSPPDGCDPNKAVAQLAGMVLPAQPPVRPAAYFVDLIRRMAEVPALAAHAQTLQGPRTRGSTTERGLDALHGGEPFFLEDVPQEIRRPGCRYFVAHAAELGSRVRVLPHAACVERNLPVESREGPHGPELFAKVPEALLDNLGLLGSGRVGVVVGPPTEFPEFPDGVVYTWHPGPFLLDLRAGETPTPLTAVKLEVA